MRPPGAILAPGETIIATGNCFFFSSCILVLLDEAMREMALHYKNIFVTKFSPLLKSAVFKFVEPPENNEKPMDQRSRVKFKIMSLKVKGPMDYVPELVCGSNDLYL